MIVYAVINEKDNFKPVFQTKQAAEKVADMLTKNGNKVYIAKLEV